MLIQKEDKMKIAIIGSGISALAAGYFLHKKYDLTIFEKNDYIGGHSNTANINFDRKKIAVDTGFIVFNFRTYPNLKALFQKLNVAIEKSNMSFGIRDYDRNFEYSGNDLSGLFAQKSNIFRPKFLKMIFDIAKFNKEAIKLVKNDKISNKITLEEFVTNLKLGEYFKNYYLFPMAGAIWSCPLELIKNYPAKTFLQFFYNHGLLTIFNQPQWYTVKGGSQEYVKKLSAGFKDKIKLNCEITKSEQKGKKIILTDKKGQEYEFDKVIFASHADQTYKIIKDKTGLEKEILSKIKYSKNIAILHKDKNQMPKNKKAWASWVYLSSKNKNQVSLTYWMNNLQNLNINKPLFVTLNPFKKISKKDIIASYNYEHPIFNLDAVEAAKKLDEIQDQRNIYFCGAWAKYGFHEDGLNSAINIMKYFDVDIGW
ncbi:NAD(P)-binding protein [Rickettsiales bacterium]|nr:NAD(P)-binding protein [Rickettsiales bacterium]